MALAVGPLRRRCLRLQHDGRLGQDDPRRRHAARPDRMAAAGPVFARAYGEYEVGILLMARDEVARAVSATRPARVDLLVRPSLRRHRSPRSPFHLRARTTCPPLVRAGPARSGKYRAAILFGPKSSISRNPSARSFSCSTGVSK